MPELDTVIDYHEATKHSFERYAPGPGSLDWATQPNPFRRFAGARLIPLQPPAAVHAPRYDAIFAPAGRPDPVPLDQHAVSRLFFDSLALSAWKSTASSRWALRVNASSGNLHPTEAYLVCGPVDGLCERPMVAHYAPRQHGLEVRAEFPLELWQRLAEGFPAGSCFIGLSSIHWREAWKYGQRAWRYCMLDAGHALAAVSFAAAGLGWHVRLLEEPGSEELAALLGSGLQHGAESEHPDLLLACMPWLPSPLPQPASAVLAECAGLAWQGTPNQLSPAHVDWGMDTIACAVCKPRGLPDYPMPGRAHSATATPMRDVSLHEIVRRRRSALGMDAQTRLDAASWYRLLERTLGITSRPPFDALPWRSLLQLVLMVHRVDGVAPGLYLLLRDPAQQQRLAQACTGVDVWTRPDGCPDDVPLYRLVEGDFRHAARAIACHQEIAGDGCFSVAMLADFLRPLRSYGAWMYPRLYWEAGMIGQLLYLEAEAAGLRGTGIGCYFDDPMHQLLGVADRQWQDLYHFTIGGPIEDTRLTTLPAYG